MGWFNSRPSKSSPPQGHQGIPIVKFDASKVTESVRAEVRRGVDQIKGLERRDLDQVHNAALQCVSVGRDLHVFCVALMQVPIASMTQRKAAVMRHCSRRASRSITQYVELNHQTCKVPRADAF